MQSTNATRYGLTFTPCTIVILHIFVFKSTDYLHISSIHLKYCQHFNHLPFRVPRQFSEYTLSNTETRMYGPLKSYLQTIKMNSTCVFVASTAEQLRKIVVL